MFGLSEKAVYAPTESPVKVTVLEYVPADGERLERLLSLPLDKMLAAAGQKGIPAAVPVGHCRLELCQSEDNQFCALQLFRYSDFKYTAAFDARFFEGKEAEAVTKLFR